LKFADRMTRRSFVWVGGVCLAACLFPGSVGAQAQDLPNFHQVSPGIYRGAAPTSEGLRRLRTMGVRTIIDLRISPKQVKQEKARAEQLGFRWLNLPMGSEPPTSKQVSTLLSTLKLAPAEPVFVHCQHGADRTGCMIGIWRVTQQNWSFSQTYKEMRQYGFKPYYRQLADAVRQRAKSPPNKK
jgi:protein tyrosine/serine phosphatase